MEEESLWFSLREDWDGIVVEDIILAISSAPGMLTWRTAKLGVLCVVGERRTLTPVDGERKSK